MKIQGKQWLSVPSDSEIVTQDSEINEEGVDGAKNLWVRKHYQIKKATQAMKLNIATLNIR